VTLPPEAEETTVDVTKALFVRLEAKPGKEADVAEFLCSALPIVEDPATLPHPERSGV
jgi:hypothetical protein